MLGVCHQAIAHRKQQTVNRGLNGISKPINLAIVLAKVGWCLLIALRYDSEGRIDKKERADNDEHHKVHPHNVLVVAVFELVPRATPSTLARG